MKMCGLADSTLIGAFRRELVELSGMPGMTPDITNIVIGGDPEHLSRAVEPDRELMALETSIVQAYRELLDWLERHSHDWEAVDDEFRFASDELARAYERRMDAIADLRRTWGREFASPSRIAWSGF